MHGIIEGLITGIIVAITWIYAMQPNIVYPEWILTSFDHPWTLLIFLLAIVYIGYYISHVIGALLFLMFVALVLDLSAFGRNGPVNYYKERPDIPGGPIGITESPESPVGPLGQMGLPVSHTYTPEYPLFYGMHDLQPGEPAGF